MIGQTLKHYRIDSALGQGGMGVVYRAMDTRLNRPVALKVLPPELTGDEDRRRRFLQEARTAGSLNHPAIAQIYDVDETDKVTFIAMELIEGRTVRQLILDRELDIQGAVEISIQAAEGLAKAHGQGIVHRDIKSDNIMVTRDGHAKILDFGLAKLLDTGGEAGDTDRKRMSMLETMARTQDGMVLGTMSYMSPEQARGQAVDHRSDLFSFGIVLYEMATGELPFKGRSPVDTLHAIAYEETRPVTTVRANLPSGLHRIVSRCLRKRPEDRYASADTLVEDLKRLQKEMESGISAGVPLSERLREGMRSLGEMTPGEWLWPLAGVALVAVIISLLAFTDLESWLPATLFMGFIGLIVWRRMKNRRHRLMRRFSARVRRMPEVRIITFHGDQAVVIVDRAMAKTYVRINAFMDRVNRKKFFGEPFSVVIRDSLTPEDEREALAQPGVLHVRDDVLGGD